MTAATQARRAATSTPLEVSTRIGFIGYGLLHLAVGWLALQIALGKPTDEGDQAGAFRTLGNQPFGHALLFVVAVGLAAMALWQLLLAAVGHHDQQGKARTLERLASAGRTVIYSALAWTAAKIVMGKPASSANQQQQASAGIMAHSAGQWLVGLCGLAVAALGVGFVVYGLKCAFERRLMMYKMSAPVRRAVHWLGRIGYVAKGVAFGIVGLLLLDAAVTRNPGKSRGLDAALHAVVSQPFGVFLLILVALGFAAFGVYCFFQARYRKVTA
jgi:hypothetical protein